MKGIAKTFIKAFDKAKERGFDTLYISIDLHETLIRPDYVKSHKSLDFYPYSIETLKKIQQIPQVRFILYTCSWPDEIEQYIKLLNQEGLEFDQDYVNKNPDASNTKYGYYENKHYTNILLDDKAGFEAELDEDGHNDWTRIMEALDQVIFKNGHQSYFFTKV